MQGNSATHGWGTSPRLEASHRSLPERDPYAKEQSSTGVDGFGSLPNDPPYSSNPGGAFSAVPPRQNLFPASGPASQVPRPAIAAYNSYTSSSSNDFVASTSSQAAYLSPLQNDTTLYQRGARQASGPGRFSSAASYNDTSMNRLTSGLESLELCDGASVELASDEDVEPNDENSAENSYDECEDEEPENSAKYYSKSYSTNDGTTNAGSYAMNDDMDRPAVEPDIPTTATPRQPGRPYKNIKTQDPSTKKDPLFKGELLFDIAHPEYANNLKSIVYARRGNLRREK